jgi:transcription elongation factor GreA
VTKEKENLTVSEMTQEEFDRLSKELEYLRTTERTAIAEKIRVARGHGDLSENSEYDEAKNEQGKLYSRIAELEDILLHAVIVDESEDSDKISIGCRVTVTNLDNGKKLPEYRIVGSQEADVMARAVSEDSPFGKALMGRKVGDEISVEAPRGVIRYRVEKIER